MKKSKENIMLDKNTFLRAISEYGTILKGCEAAGISRRTYERWSSEDEEFSKDVGRHRIMFSEYLEGVALYRVMNPEKGIGTDAMLYNLLAANNPDKYRVTGTGVDESAKEVLFELKKLSRKERRELPVEEVGTEIPVSVARELDEIMEKRSNAPEGSEGLQE